MGVFASRRKVVSFYGNRVGAEAASYGYICALNRIILMAGSRAVPQDGRITWNQGPTTSEFGKPRGKRFSEVLAKDPDYFAWAKGQEARLRRLGEQSNEGIDNSSTTPSSDSIDHFLGYAARKAGRTVKQSLSSAILRFTWRE